MSKGMAGLGAAVSLLSMLLWKRCLLLGVMLFPPVPAMGDPKERVLWTTSRILDTPDPPLSLRTRPAFPHLRFDHPLDVALYPDRERLVVLQIRGKMYLFPNDESVEEAQLFFDLRKHEPELQDAYGVTFDPNFAHNRFVYLSYTLKGKKPNGTRVSRFKVTNTEPPQIDPASEEILITWLAGGHNGACLKFGPEGYLYISTGDGAGPNPPDTHRTGQDCSDLLSSILRIDVHPEDRSRPYVVPPDNPFVDRAGVRPEIWAFGFRNPWKMAFDGKTGDLWVGDVGWDVWELVFNVKKGANYGWSIMEGSQPINRDVKLGPAPISPPTYEHPHSEARSVTGGYVYEGKAFAELQGGYVYGDYNTGKFWVLHYRDENVQSVREIADSNLRVVTFGEDGDGDLLIVDYGGTLHRLERNPSAGQKHPPFPGKLSETGLFSSLENHKPAPGVIPYKINAERWADGALSERLLGIPGEGQIEDAGPWNLPEGSVVAKTLSLETEIGNPESRLRIETQILHRHATGWKAYTYAWNDEETEATLVPPDGGERILTILDPKIPGGHRSQRWKFLSRVNCMSCHNGRGGVTRALNSAQLNRDIGIDGEAKNQLERMQSQGFFRTTVNLKVPPTAHPFDERLDLDLRARTYLHLNCSSCHRPNGGGLVPMNLGIGQTLAKTGTLNEDPVRGDFGIPGSKVIAPGDPYKSMLYYRMATLGSGRMPHLASTEVDVKGLDLIHRWIKSLPAAKGPWSDALKELAAAPSNPSYRRLVREFLAREGGGLALMQAMGPKGPLHARRVKLARLAVDLAPENAGLFDRFLPPQERRTGTRKDFRVILALQGDIARGLATFDRSLATSCLVCHQLGEKGKAIGPSLEQIAAQRSPREILEGLLEPSKTVARDYLAHTVQTMDGEVTVGIIKKRTDKELALLDLSGATKVIDVTQVKTVTPHPQSLMPEGLLEPLTNQEIADVLAFLKGLGKE